jgi:hypothetical protein
MAREKPVVQLDNTYDDRRKIQRAWRTKPAAIGLHVMAITFSNRHDTDGQIPHEWLQEMVPRTTERQAILQVLVEHGLFDFDGEQYTVHDYLDWNRSAEEREARRRAAANAAAMRWARNGHA